MLSAASVQAGEILAEGDGSGTNNPDFYGAPAAGCVACELGSLAAYDAPPLDIDWSVGLRGGYLLSSTQGGSYEASILPHVAVSFAGRRTTANLSADAEFVGSSRDGFRIASGVLDLSGTYKLDEVTTLTGTADLSVTQDEPGDDGLAKPRVLSGEAEVGITREVGRLDVSARANVGRDIYGPTVDLTGMTVDNSWDNNTTAGVGARLSYPVTPVFAAFVDGSAAYRMFDAASPALGVKLDGPTYVGSVGLTYDPNSVISAEASVGVALRQFDAGFADITATLYNAKVTFRPDETLTFDAAFSTELGAPQPDDPGRAQITYAALADIAYTINPWMGVRASANWYRAESVSTGLSETGYGFGAGLDYRLNRHTMLTADYTFAHVVPAVDPVRDEHRFTVGVTFSK
jgi:hypothetical protein